ncbi:hypothetical protein D3C84_1160500 [compost metagenome]
MPGDGKAVRLVADLLDQVQCRRIRRQGELVGCIVEVEGFEAWLAGDALGDAKQNQLRHCQFPEHFLRHGELAFATVHQQNVR